MGASNYWTRGQFVIADTLSSRASSARRLGTQRSRRQAKRRVDFRASREQPIDLITQLCRRGDRVRNPIRGALTRAQAQEIEPSRFKRGEQVRQVLTRTG